MRRPLFWVALCLVMIAVLRLETGSCDRPREGYISTGRLEAYELLTITGQVYQKDDESVYLKSVNLINYDSFKFKITIQSAVESQRQIPIQENIICDIDGAGKLPLGSTVMISGTFMPFSQATNPGEFDAAEYYRTLKIGGRLVKAELLETGEGCWRLREGLYGLKKYFRQRLYRVFPEKEASIMSALLLGDKSELDPELKDLYKRNGILHILSISSLHITIIGMSVYKLLRRAGIPIGAAACAGSVLLLLYGGMTGFGVSACRAIGMYLLRMLAELLGRTYDMVIALGVLAAVMVTANPCYLRHSGFLLSFTSVLGIGVVYQNLLPRTQKPPGKRSLWVKFKKSFTQSVVASLSITLATLPIQLWFYYEVPVYSVLLNLLVLPFMKPLMITGLLVMLLPGMGFLSGADQLILKSYELLCAGFDGLPFHVWNPGRPEKWQMAAYYGILAGVVWLAGRSERKRSLRQEKDSDRGRLSAQILGKATGPASAVRRLAAKRVSTAERGKTAGHKSAVRKEITARLLTVTALSAAVLLLGYRPPGENRVVFLDVGQGDCILVQTASGENYLFDCGSSNRSGVGRYVLLPFLKYSGIHKLDAVLLSHPDMDHVGGAMELFSLAEENSIEIGQLVLPAVEEAEREAEFQEIIRAAGKYPAWQQRALKGNRKTAVEVRYLAAGESWQCGSADFLCLHPEAGWSAADKNAYSMCVYVSFAEDVSLLLTGDVEGPGEEALIRALKEKNLEDITILKTAHHGSRNSTAREFLAQIKPGIAVISCGRNNRYGHPHAELLERLEDCGAKIYLTPEGGAVTVRAGRGSVEVETYIHMK